MTAASCDDMGGPLPGAIIVIGLATIASGRAWAQATVGSAEQPAPRSAPPEDAPPQRPWAFGAFIDAAFINSFNSPSNHLFRSRGTTPRVGEVDVNMAGVYVRKVASGPSPWGAELTVQSGEDAKTFGFSATAPNMSGANWLRHLGPTNVSRVLPIGSGLTLQGGIFSSLVGYDSLYAKDNLTHTRPWSADFTPYLMLGVNAAYPVSDRLTVTGLVVNGYWHLAHANNVPSVGGQAAYKIGERATLKQTLLYGPHQSKTSVGYWRILADTIIERKDRQLTAAVEFQLSTERVEAQGSPRALWLAAQAPLRWTLGGPWAVTVRPEFAWDRDGRWTTFEQAVKAVTTTLEYRAFRRPQQIVRLEHRFDRSTGRAGGFFTDVGPGVVGLTPDQSLLMIGWILTFDATAGAAPGARRGAEHDSVR